MGHVFRTEEQQAAVDGLKRFLDAEIDPIFSKQYRDKFVPRDKMAEIMRRLTEFGLVSGIASEANGGMGLDWLTSLMLFEEVATTSADLSVPVLINSFGVVLLEKVAPPHLRERYLPGLLRGDSFVSMGISEPDVGSNVLEIKTRARRDGDHFIINGEKTWISNGGIADFYVVFARTGEASGARGISAFIVEAGTPGFEIAERIDVIAPHPLARLRFRNCRIPVSQRVGAAGEGFKVAMRTLDVFRTSVAAAALGFARRALDEGLARATTRRMFKGLLADFQLTQAKLAQMATTIDSSALLVYRAAWQRDQGRNVTREAAMAKMVATEGAQQVIDSAVQLFGGLGVTQGQMVESLYREIRSLRIYEGATEVQLLIIARELLRDASPKE